MIQIKINNFDELIEVIEKNNFKRNVIDEIILLTLGSLVFYNSKKELIKSLKDYQIKWSTATEKPIFIGLENIDVSYNVLMQNDLFRKEIEKIEAKY